MKQNTSTVARASVVLTGWLAMSALPGTAASLALAFAPPAAHASAPPAWAPANGVRRKEATRYRYYPSQQVYFDVSSQVWFYMNVSTGVWLSGARLPVTIVIGPTPFVELDMVTNRPYVYHRDVIVKYPRKGSKQDGGKDRSGSGSHDDSRKEHGKSKGHR